MEALYTDDLTVRSVSRLGASCLVLGRFIPPPKINGVVQIALPEAITTTPLDVFWVGLVITKNMFSSQPHGMHINPCVMPRNPYGIPRNSCAIKSLVFMED